MALTIGDNFSYLGAKPLDGRLKYDTISAMVGMSASTLYDGIMAYCAEDGKEYQWKSSNTSDPTLGKWREFASGGGGASALDDLTDVDITSASNGQVLKYDSTNSEWVNADEVSVPSAYTSTPEMDGTASAGSSTSWAKGDHVHPSDTAKADKVASATNGDFAGLDSNGNLTDSGKTATDFAKILTVADAFDSTATYNIGDRCTYNGAFYKFTAAHTGAWDAADATELTINDAILSNTIGIGGGYAPIGTIISYMGTTAPQDYLACDGSTKNIADYPQLADFFESQFGSKNYFGGNGTTTFGLPDLRGEFLRGTGTNSHTNQGSGANVGVHQDATEHVNLVWTNNNDLNAVRNPNGTWLNYGVTKTVKEDSQIGLLYNFAWSGSGGYDGGMTNKLNSFYTSRPTNTSILYCIKAVCAGEVYSTEEREVGTWIGGEKLWQKTINFGSLPNDTTKSVAHNISNIGTIVNVEGVYVNTTIHRSYMMPWGTTTNGTIIATTDVDNENIRIMANGDRTGVNAYITIRYTKTT